MNGKQCAHKCSEALLIPPKHRVNQISIKLLVRVTQEYVDNIRIHVTLEYMGYTRIHVILVVEIYTLT